MTDMPFQLDALGLYQVMLPVAFVVAFCSINHILWVVRRVMSCSMQSSSMIGQEKWRGLETCQHVEVLSCGYDMVQGLQLMSTLNVPIYITETGIADAAGDRRPLWLQTYIPEVMLYYLNIFLHTFQ